MFNRVIKGIGVVTCMHVNPDGDEKYKLDQVQDMLDNDIFAKEPVFRCVLMGTWYATKKLMTHIESALLHKSEVVLDVSCCDEKFSLKKATLQDEELV